MTPDGLRAYLNRCARPVTYGQVMRDLSAPSLNSVTQALEILMDQDMCAGQPFLAALVVSRTRPLPARGFFDHARALGRDVGDEALFHAAELAALGKPHQLP